MSVWNTVPFGPFSSALMRHPLAAIVRRAHDTVPRSRLRSRIDSPTLASRGPAWCSALDTLGRSVAVTIFGPWHGVTSWSHHARQFATALGRIQEVLTTAYDSPDGHPRTQPPDADIVMAIGEIARMAGLPGRHRIGFVVWETTAVPREKLSILAALDEVWVPSDWGRSVLIANGLAADRVHVVPEGVDPALFRPADPAPAPASRPFRFLCVGKWEVRKGIDDLVRAFAREFASDEPVELLLHCHNPYVGGFDTRYALDALALPPHAPIRPSPPLPL